MAEIIAITEEEKVFNERFASGEPRDRLSFFIKQQERPRRRKERIKRKFEETPEQRYCNNYYQDQTPGNSSSIKWYQFSPIMNN